MFIEIDKFFCIDTTNIKCEYNLKITLYLKGNFINKEHKELLNELLLIIKKAKLYIQDKAGNSYENIINQIGIK